MGMLGFEITGAVIMWSFGLVFVSLTGLAGIIWRMTHEKIDTNKKTSEKEAELIRQEHREYRDKVSDGHRRIYEKIDEGQDRVVKLLEKQTDNINILAISQAEQRGRLDAVENRIKERKP
jgi:hypothetical protein